MSEAGSPKHIEASSFMRTCGATRIDIAKKKQLKSDLKFWGLISHEGSLVVFSRSSLETAFRCRQHK